MPPASPSQHPIGSTVWYLAESHPTFGQVRSAQSYGAHGLRYRIDGEPNDFPAARVFATAEELLLDMISSAQRVLACRNCLESYAHHHPVPGFEPARIYAVEVHADHQQRAGIFVTLDAAIAQAESYSPPDSQQKPEVSVLIREVQPGIPGQVRIVWLQRWTFDPALYSWRADSPTCLVPLYKASAFLKANGWESQPTPPDTIPEPKAA